MTKTSATDTTTPTGQHGVLLTCSCGGHGGGHAAIHATPTKAADFPKARIHGFVRLAHDPVAGALAAKMGKTWKA
jgi:hypothetical protein